MADLGVRAYRFSVSWSRVLPTGAGAINEAGLDFYQRLVDALLGAGVQPLINLFHWDLPQALQDRGGFADPQVVGWFTDYAALVASRLGDRVGDWMTFNEPAVFAFLGHADGIHAPGLRDWPTAIRVADNELRAHAAAAGVIRCAGPRRADRRGDRCQPGRAGIRFGSGSRGRGRVELRARRVVPRPAVRPRLPGARTRGAPRRGPPRRRRACRTAGRRPRLPGSQLLPPRLGQREVGPPIRLGDRRAAGLGADADGLARRSRRPARRPDRAQPDVRPARDRGHREWRGLPRHRRPERRDPRPGSGQLPGPPRLGRRRGAATPGCR